MFLKISDIWGLSVFNDIFNRKNFFNTVALGTLKGVFGNNKGLNSFIFNSDELV